ncbi:Na+ dependent transporter (SNF family) [Thermogladius calderae 1633]|uniref:Na+ dependent transporter (SNF family) n=1 Tax=Thermogladius calderae (strain DSM 22663 / VKM B-2946 / 1633) TaxID=1184251 RepID=I3TFE5_THEC1|nr:Na+ dependent transporter (SNF family) [Thermogladius calderae]AFK51483.1 Na+ dependent transporter (SNF family) [Thermogladius calderae 1633]
MSSEAIGPRETWGTRIGLILSMAGNAIGLGNFLRFPGRVALYGGGAYLIPYFVALTLLGLPIMWLEWSIGRYGGQYRAHWLAPMMYVVSKRRLGDKKAKIVAGIAGGLALSIAILLNAYYTNLLGWVSFWAGMCMTGKIVEVTEVKDSIGWLLQVIGNPVYNLLPWVFTLVMTGIIVAPGVSKGLERANLIMMPLLFLFSVVLLVTGLTWRTPVKPEWDSIKGFLWLWTPRFEKLGDPAAWLEGAGQIFFTLSLGIAGIIPTYASYIKREDDIALGALTTTALNEFAEVICGGTIAFTLGYAFGGVLPIGMVYVDKKSPFFLSMAVYPAFFGKLGAVGAVLGFMWYVLLWFAGVTSAIAIANVIVEMLQGFGWKRAQATAVSVLLFLVFGVFIALEGYMTKDYSWGPSTVYLDFTDFMVGSVMLVVTALFETIIAGMFLWPEGYEEVNRGGLIRVPKALWKYVLSIIAPIYLVAMLVWLPMSTRIETIIYQTGEPLTWLGPALAGLSAAFTVALFIVGFVLGVKSTKQFEKVAG